MSFWISRCISLMYKFAKAMLMFSAIEDILEGKLISSLSDIIVLLAKCNTYQMFFDMVQFSLPK